jgi:hypothetical protein
VWVRQDAKQAGGTKEYHCVIPDSQNPNQQHHFVIRATDDRSALKAILEEIEKTGG